MIAVCLFLIVWHDWILSQSVSVLLHSMIEDNFSLRPCYCLLSNMTEAYLCLCVTA